MNAERAVPDLPRYSLDVQAMDLGEQTKAVGLELIETESREPLRGPEAIEIWSSTFAALTAKEHYVLDFFSHLERVRDFCAAHKIEFRESARRCVVVEQPTQEQVRELLGRFEGETFGLRAGPGTQREDAELENELSHRGLDAYQDAYGRYEFCAVCELSDGWVTVLSEKLWPSEIIRRARPALHAYDVYIARPQ